MDSGWPAAFALAAATALLLLALTPLTTLWDRDEPRFAQAAVEMRASGDYLVPTFNGEVRPQKPPLIYWLMTRSLAVFGPRELAVRFWSPIGIAIAALATFAIGRRITSPAAGLIAMVVLVTTPLSLVEGVAATTDAMLLGLITASLAVGVEWLYRPPPWWHALAMGVLLGLGALTKGPVGIGIPFVVLAGTLLLVRHTVPWRGRFLLTLGVASVAGVAIFAAWYLPAAARVAAIGNRGPIDETLARVVEIRDGHGTSIVLAPLYYAAVIAIGFAPWTPKLFRALRATGQSRWRSTPDVLLAVWIGFPLVALTIAATKLPHYILPVWPALALVIGRAFVSREVDGRSLVRRVMRRAGIGAVVLLALAIGGGRLAERYKPAASVAAAVRASGVEGPLFVYEFAEPSLVFYSGRRLIEIPTEGALVEWARAPGPAVLAAPRAAIVRIERFYGPLGLREEAAQSGWNYVNGQALELVAFVRASDR